MTALLLASILAAAPAPQLGAEIAVDRPTRGPVVSVLGDVKVASEVVGDVVALGGSVELAEGAIVRGDVVALGGRVTGKGSVAGRAVAVSILAGSGVTSVGGGLRPSLAWGMAVLRMGLWVTLGSLLLLARPRWVRGAAEQIAALSWRAPLVGVLALAVWLVVMMLALAVTASPLGVACLLLAVGGFLFAKLIGVTGVAWVAGKALVGWLPRSWRSEPTRTGSAILLLLLVSLLPGVGAAVWLLANVIGVGAVAGMLLQRRPLAVLLPRLAAR